MAFVEYGHQTYEKLRNSNMKQAYPAKKVLLFKPNSRMVTFFGGIVPKRTEYYNADTGSIPLPRFECQNPLIRIDIHAKPAQVVHPQQSPLGLIRKIQDERLDVSFFPALHVDRE